MKRLLLSILVSIALPQIALAQAIEGTARAIDGDTIDMTGMRVRLLHIDAPEAAQTCSRGGEPWACGTDATAALTSLLNGQTVSCISTSRDKYDRYLAVCRTRIMDIGEQMVAQGLAVADDDAPEEYQTAAQRAKTMKLGLWNSDFQMPREWRAASIPASQPSQASRSSTRARPTSSRSYRSETGCAIKGNRSRRGEWIYHLPGQQYYNQTRPEQLFCSEAEAQAAGYRRSKV